jgi:hypothetical protein
MVTDDKDLFKDALEEMHTIQTAELVKAAVAQGKNPRSNTGGLAGS